MAAMSSCENALFIHVVHRLCSFAFDFKTQPIILVIFSTYPCWISRVGTTEGKKFNTGREEGRRSTAICRNMGAARDVPN